MSRSCWLPFRRLRVSRNRAPPSDRPMSRYETAGSIFTLQLARTMPRQASRRLPEANVCGVMANADVPGNRASHTMMTSDPRYRALFLGAGPQMQCGVGHFTRLLYETIEKPEPGSNTSLTLTRSEGSFADIWRAVGSAQSVVCNFPIVAWKRVIVRAAAGAGLCQAAAAQDCPDSARMGRAALAAPHHLYSGVVAGRYHHHVLAAGAARTGRRIRWSAGPPKNACWRRCRRTSRRRQDIADSKLRQRLAAARAEGRLVIGHFGSIYPAKQPNALLNIGATPESNAGSSR